MTVRNQTKSRSKKAARQTGVPTGQKGRVRRKASTSESHRNLKTGHTGHTEQKEIATTCVNCGGELLFVDETRLCPKCNSEASISMIHELSAVILEPAEMDRGFIECPGATIFDSETGEPVEGAVFADQDDGVYTVRHAKWPVYPPGHKRRRMIPTEAYGKIRRCRACQDYTVRMRRKEGADFCAPSAKFPHRKRLKTIDLVSHRQTP